MGLDQDHQESQWPTCWAIFFSSLAGLGVIGLGYPYQESPLKRTVLCEKIFNPVISRCRLNRQN